MAYPSPLSTAAFVAIIVAVLSFLCWAHVTSGRDQPRTRLRNVLSVCAIWLSGTGALVLVRFMGQPGFIVLFAALIALIAASITLALSPYGRRIALGVPIAALVGLHGFRLPLEMVLHDWWQVGFLPIQMTFEGDNFDIVTGVLAILIGLLSWRREELRWPVWLFNLIGFVLLIRIIGIVALSNPTPLRAAFGGYPIGEEVEIALYFPYVWLPTVLVPTAMFFHIILFRRLLIRSYSNLR